MVAKRKGEKSLLNRQEIATRRKALTQKKLSRQGTGRRAIAGVLLLAGSVLSLLSVATFNAKDRVGPGFKNAIGPVGHAIAEAMRGLLGVCAYVLPLVGLYAAGLLFVGERDRRRWPQALALGLLLVTMSVLAQLMFTEDASWAHAPGGLIGRQVGGLMTALFSTVGTVVLVSAIAAVAFIVGTQFAFLKFCGWVWEKSLVLGERFKAWFLVFLEKQKLSAEQRRLEAEKAKTEDEAFLAQLEAEESELSELELAANEAEEAADELARIDREREHSKLADLAERERLKAEREKLMVEREAARLAREALKAARANQKDARKETAAAMAPALLEEARPHQATVPSISSAPIPTNGEPAWTAALAFGPMSGANASQPPLAPELVQSAPPPQRRVPTIVEPPGMPPPPPAEALNPSKPPMTAMQATEAVGAIATAPQVSALAHAMPQALARLPLIVEPKAPPKPTKKEQFEFVGGRTSFNVPPLDLLEMHERARSTIDKDSYLQTAERLSAKLKDFGIDGEVVEIRPGPVVTMYEFKPAAGVKISRIASLADDLAMAMEAMRVRIVAPIPGKGVVGIEVPNKEREMVFLKEIAEQDAFQKSQGKLTMCLGKDIEGMPYILDLSKAPHLLMAGTTGSGKSVAVNAMIMSILLKSTPEEVRFIMVDPKMLELSVYEGIPHLLLPVVTDPRKAAVALQWGVEEMTRRYKLLSEAGVRNISGYNSLIDAEQAKKKASQQVVDAKPTVIKPKAAAPKVDAPVAEAPKGEVEAAPPAPPVEGEKPKKKRRMLIVDVAEGGVEAPVEAGANATPSPAGLELGVAAPQEAAEDPREGFEAIAAEVEAAEKAAVEIRVEDVPSESELEAAALAEAASSAAQAEAEAEAAKPTEEERKKLPYIVVIIDELADLMMVASKEVETSIARLAQMARAAGIHLMVATQRPSTDVVTGIIKANFPTRISFMLRSKPDSMTILGTVGAEALLGMGDMLIMPPTSAHMQRVHGCYVSEGEIKKVVDQLRAQGKPVYDENILKPREEEGGEGIEDDLSDELYDQAIAVVSEMRQVSISMLQRKMRIGYNRSARMIERMEREGLVGAADGAKPRDVLIRPVGQMPGAAAM
jgi:S-DNA-T family DNA segregation ATPase FtsK/SpoIIIE